MNDEQYRGPRKAWWRRKWNALIIWSWTWRFPDYDGSSEPNERMSRGWL